jgi:hypothetical protein
MRSISLMFLKRKKFWKRTFWFGLITPIIVFSILVLVVYVKQDSIVKNLIKNANKDFTGSIRIKDSHVAPFANFPYISIDIEELEIFEGKNRKKSERIVHIKDAYIGFDILELLSGKYDVKSVRLLNGDLRIIQHKNGDFNIIKAFESKKPAKEIEEELHLDLQSIKLDNIDVSKFNESNGIMVDVLIENAKTRLQSTKQNFTMNLDSKFQLNLIKDGDTTFLKHKHFEVATELDFEKSKQILKVEPTEITLEKATFNFDGSVDFLNDVFIDLHFSGKKPDFNLFLALAPEELMPTLKKFENKGEIYFDATVKGKSINGAQPLIKANFGCSEGYFNNLESGKKLDKIGFKGSFTNGKKRNSSTMRFVLENFTAKPEAGTFKGKLVVENFDSPDVDMNLNSDFDLEFLSKFMNTPELKGLSGRIGLIMNFRDIIDIENPERSIERLNESYYSELKVQNLKFVTDALSVPVKGIDLYATVEGHEAKIDYLNIKMGRSDLKIKGFISDLPAIIHHTSTPVTTDLQISSNLIDVKELSSGIKDNKPIDEQIENLRLNLKFLSSAKSFTESPSLPIGEFFITNLYAKMKHYPHTLHDFHADVFVEEKDFRVMDFSGMIDNSDFHFSGKLNNYNLWFDEKMQGDTKIEFDLTSKHLQLDNLFSYGGENFVPEDYRHEVIDQLKIHGRTDLHFYNGLKSIDFYLTELNGKMEVHPLRFEKFKGSCHLEDGQLTVKNFSGKMGHSTFNINLDYALEKGKYNVPNQLSITGDRLDLDELLNNNSAASLSAEKKVDHDKVFSIYDFDFPQFKIKADVGQLNYHKYNLVNFKAKIRLEKNHMIHCDKFDFTAAGGKFDITGYLSGKDKEHIYFNPVIKISHLDLDRFMVKFDNFGQDHLVSENLHGIFTGKITGKIHLHADLVPKIDDSELYIDMNVYNGKLENYAPLLALGDYFEDSKLKEVRFDTLTNVLTLKKSNISIPTMTINSSLGFMEIRGDQRIDGAMKMHYLIGVPWKLVTQVAGRKLFGRLVKDKPSENEIQYRQKNSKFLYLKLKGDLDNYSISISKNPK